MDEIRAEFHYAFMVYLLEYRRGNYKDTRYGMYQCEFACLWLVGVADLILILTVDCTRSTVYDEVMTISIIPCRGLEDTLRRSFSHIIGNIGLIT